MLDRNRWCYESLLWFKRRLPPYATKFLEMVLQLTADHGPAVSGAMTTIITTRAGKDLVSSLVAGLLTIGSRFGGALDGAAAEFTRALDTGLSPREFVDSMRKANKLIPGIGHKIKSKTNPDLRVELVKKYVKEHFPVTTVRLPFYTLFLSILNNECILRLLITRLRSKTSPPAKRTHLFSTSMVALRYRLWICSDLLALSLPKKPKNT